MRVHHFGPLTHQADYRAPGDFRRQPQRAAAFVSSERSNRDWARCREYEGKRRGGVVVLRTRRNSGRCEVVIVVRQKAERSHESLGVSRRDGQVRVPHPTGGFDSGDGFLEADADAA